MLLSKCNKKGAQIWGRHCFPQEHRPGRIKGFTDDPAAGDPTLPTVPQLNQQICLFMSQQTLLHQLPDMSSYLLHFCSPFHITMTYKCALNYTLIIQQPLLFCG